MELICSISKYIEPPCTFFLTLLPEINPYWRSDIVMIGIAASAIGTIISLINGYTLISVISFIATCILLFTIYYVDSYINFIKLEEQIKAFKQEVFYLKKELLDLQETHQALSVERTNFSIQNTNLKEEISRLTQINDLMDGKFTTLTEATNQVDAIMNQMQTAQKALQQITTTIHEESAKHAALNQQSIHLQEQITQETSRLKEIGNQFSLYADSLEKTAIENALIAPKLNASIEELRSLVSKIRTSTAPPYEGSLTHFFNL